MTTYKLLTDPISNNVESVLLDNKTHIPFDPANVSYQKYLAWLDEGNEPLPADEPAE
jgi:hypothetical protein